MFVSAGNDIDEVPVYAKLRKLPEPMQSVRHHVREGFNGPLQL